jgi:hypothetical protein
MRLSGVLPGNHDFRSPSLRMTDFLGGNGYAEADHPPSYDSGYEIGGYRHSRFSGDKVGEMR